MSGRARTVLAVLACALLAGAGLLVFQRSRQPSAPPPGVSETSYVGAPFGRIAVYRPAGEPRATALFLSGDAGWNDGAAAIARDLAARGVLVAGVSTPVLMKALEERPGKCIDPNYPLIALARDVQHRTGVHTYMKPVIIGYSAGATIAYVSLAQWPNGGYRGVFSLGFSADTTGRKPWCHGGPGFMAHPIRRPSQGWLFAPSRHIKVPWIVLQGQEDHVVDFGTARRFVGKVPGTTFIPLPDVDHFFSDHRQWMPQFWAQLGPMLNPIVAQRDDGLPPDMPITLVSPIGKGGPSDVMAVIYSGDGGWVGIDRDVAAQLSSRGIPVVGIDSLAYFWSARTPAGAGQDLKRIIDVYSARWQRPRIMLIGYSFGADTLPAIVGTLDPATRARIASLSLLGLSPTADFQFHLTSWLDIPSDKALPTIPAVEQLKGMDIRCIHGASETDSACPLIPDMMAEVTQVPGDHHFNRNASLLAQIILAPRGLGNRTID